MYVLLSHSALCNDAKTVLAFEHVFDIRGTYRCKADMETISAIDLKMEDIIFTEFFVAHWIPNNTAPAILSSRGQV